MSRLAILVGNSEYDRLQNLSCCIDDVNAMQEFLAETHGYDQIEVLQNLKANDLKDRLRAIVEPKGAYKEILFYFTGHGCNIGDVFYFCSTDFYSSRPNETGLSNADLLEIFRVSNADLIVQIIDACNSGTRLIKEASYGILFPPPKEGIRNYIQIASCLDDQNSLTGNPLSVFTEKFIEASLKKAQGEVFYSDVISVLRDEFLENNTQTPYFISQGTGREIFIPDAAMLDTFREKMTPRAEDTAHAENVPQNVSLEERLKQKEDRFCTEDVANKFIEKLFQNIRSKAVQSEVISECYTPNIEDHERYNDNSIEAFMVRVLSKEKRPDELVTAELTRKRKKRNPIFGATSLLMQTTMGLYDDEEILETYDLSLNCSLDKAELTIILQSNYRCLSQFKLVVSCAPSVEHCYVFERCSLHKLSDWNSYSPYGEELTRRWYKMNWKDDTDFLSSKISDQIHLLVEKHVLDFLNDDEKGK